MTSHAQFISELLWITQPIFQLVTVVVLWSRKAQRHFPFFVTYLIAQVAIFAVTFPLWKLSTNAESYTGLYAWYFWVYWITAAISSVLCFKIIHEVFLDIFRPYATLKDLGTVLFKWAGVVMLMVSVVFAFSSGNQRDPLIQAIVTLDRSVRLVQCGLILFLLLFSRFLGVSRKEQSFGIALGYGLIAWVELVTVALTAGSYTNRDQMALMNAIATNLAILVWFYYAITRNGSRQGTVNHLQTQRWEQSLAGLHAREVPAEMGRDSLIPMFEGMVERAISRTSQFDATDGTSPIASVPSKATLSASASAGSKSQG